MPITLAPDPVHLVFCTQHTSIFHLCNVSTTSADLPDKVPMFQVVKLMQSGTLEVFFHPPTGFPAGHQVYDLHNDGNSVLQLGWVPHCSVCRGYKVLQRVELGELVQSFCGRMHFLSPTSRNHSLDLIFSLTTKTPEQGQWCTQQT